MAYTPRKSSNSGKEESFSQILPKQLENEIRAGRIKNLYYIYGADRRRVERLTQQLRQKIAGAGNDIACQKMDGKSFDIDTLEQSAGQYSFFSTVNCIQIHDCDAENLTTDRLKRLTNLLSDLGKASTLIFDVTGFDPKKGKKRFDGKNKTLVETIAKYGVVCEAVQPTDRELVQGVTETASAYGAKIPRDAAEEVVRRCLGNTLLLQNEMEKLCTFVGKGGTITRDIVANVTTPQPETTTYALADAVVAGNAQAALHQLDMLYAMRVERVLIVSTLSTAFLDLYRASAAIHAGKSVRDVMKDFDYRFQFRVDNAFRNCRNATLSQLAECVGIMSDLTTTLNATAGDERTYIEAAILKMISRIGGRHDTYHAGYRR